MKFSRKPTDCFLVFPVQTLLHTSSSPTGQDTSLNRYTLPKKADTDLRNIRVCQKKLSPADTQIYGRGNTPFLPEIFSVADRPAFFLPILFPPPIPAFPPAGEPGYNGENISAVHQPDTHSRQGENHALRENAIRPDSLVRPT